MNYELNLYNHGRMFPDYFQGTSGVQINIYIHKEMTIGKVIDLLKLEFDFNYDNIGYTLFEANNKLIPSDLSEKLDQLLFSIGSKNDLSKIFSPDAPSEQELDEDENPNPFIFSLTIKFID